VRTLSPARRLAVASAAAVAAWAWALFLTLVSRHTRYGSSDNANALLAGADMLRGNPLLRGWILPANSYWLVDLPVFGMASALFGVREILLHAVPAALAIVTIGVGVWIARSGRAAHRWWVAAGVLVILLGLPHLYLVITILQAPHHLGTALFCLIAFTLLAYARVGDRRWAAAAVLLAVSVRSDPMALAIGVVPVAAAGVLDAVRTRRVRALAGPFACAAAGLAGAVLLEALLRAGDGYTLRVDESPHIKGWAENLRGTPTILGALLGVLTRGNLPPLSGGERAAHLIGAGLLVAALFASVARSAAGLARGSRPSDGDVVTRRPLPSPAWLDDVLLLCGTGSIAVFALLTQPQHQLLNARYLLPGLVCAAVLTARRAIEWSPRIPAPLLAAGLGLLGIAYATTPLATVRGSMPVNPTVEVVDWLRARNLDRGYGQYWVAGITTVTGREAVAVRPVAPVDGRLEANGDFGSRRWFQDERPFRFVVLNLSAKDGVDEEVAIRTFGPPAETKDISPFRVLVWDRPLAPLALR
jgi:hypothetical protein